MLIGGIILPDSPASLVERGHLVKVCSAQQSWLKLSLRYHKLHACWLLRPVTPSQKSTHHARLLCVSCRLVMPE